MSADPEFEPSLNTLVQSILSGAGASNNETTVDV